MNLEINNKIQSQNSLNPLMFSLKFAINNVTKLVLPILGIMAISYLPTTMAGKTEYDMCVEQCDDMARSVENYIPYAFSYPACVASCFFLIRN